MARPFRQVSIGFVAAAAALLCTGGCGDGGSVVSSTSDGGTDEGVDETASNDPNLFCPEPPLGAFECGPQGEWSDFVDWSDVPPTLPPSEGSSSLSSGVLGIHAMHLHTGQIMLWQGRLDERAYNIEDGSFSWYPLTAAAGPECGIPDTGTGDLDLFCSGHAQQADGSFVVGGGNVTGSSSTTVTCAFHFDPDGASAVDPAEFDPYDPFADEPPTPPPTPWDSEDVGPMDQGRWYPTFLTLAGGEMLAVGGASSVTNEPPEVLIDGDWITFPEGSINQSFETGFYPFMFVLPDGNVLYAGSEGANNQAARAGHVLRVEADLIQSAWDDELVFASGIPGGSAVMYEPGKVMKAGGGGTPTAESERIDLSESDYDNAAWESAGTMASPRHFQSLTMLPDGRVLSTGGNTRSNGSSLHSTDNPCASDGEIINEIECTSGLACPPVPTSCRTVRSTECMANADCESWESCNESRQECEDTRCAYHEILPCTSNADCDPAGGDSPAECVMPAGLDSGFCRLACTDSSDCTPIGVCSGGACDPANNACYATKNAELWDPESDTWCLMAAEQNERMYHSSALLLPDGRIMSAGSGRRQGLVSQKNAEFFSPPYLLSGDPRPVITGVVDEDVLHYGGATEVGLDPAAVAVEDIGRVTLVRLGSATHQNNMDQRFVDLGCWTRVADDRIEIKAPENANIAPPGYYMLFLVSNAGVPSMGHYVRVGQ